MTRRTPRVVRRGVWRFRTRIASGIVALVPIVATVLVIRFIFGLTAGIFLPVVGPALESWPFPIRAALSLMLFVGGVYLLGELAAHVVGRRVLELGEQVVLKVPVIKVVYRAAKQVMGALGGPGSRAFKSVVLVEFPRTGTRSVGFLTGRIRGDDGSTWVTVFIPTTPNPTTGFLQILPEQDVVVTDMSVEEGIKMIMSLGALVPESASVVP